MENTSSIGLHSTALALHKISCMLDLSKMSSSVPATTPVNGKCEDLQALLKEMTSLKEAARLEKSKNTDVDMSSMGQKEPEVSLISPVMNIKCRKVMKGHRGRILHFDWSPDLRKVVTAGQDGNAVIWDGLSAQKELIIQTQSSWVLGCSYSPSTTLVACGGLDNRCSVYKVDERFSGEGQVPRITIPKKSLQEHSKYITHIAFFGSDQQLLTASADTTCALWDMEQKQPVMSFQGHKMEVLGLALNPKDPYTVFASGSCDRTARVWDARSGSCVMRFEGHEGDINAVRFFPSGDALGTACNDGSIHFFDLRADQQIKMYTKPSILFGASSLDFSKSGRVLFAGYDDYTIRAWDVLKGDQLTLWHHHQDRVSHIGLSPDGTALGSSSWDGTFRISA